MARRATAEIAALEQFEEALRSAHDTVWWRKFMDLIKERRTSFVEALVAGTLDQRAEDRTRGQISELTFVISLDAYGGRDGGQRETTGD
jgi:hypothetical protein